MTINEVKITRHLSNVQDLFYRAIHNLDTEALEFWYGAMWSMWCLGLLEEDIVKVVNGYQKANEFIHKERGDGEND